MTAGAIAVSEATGCLVLIIMSAKMIFTIATRKPRASTQRARIVVVVPKDTMEMVKSAKVSGSTSAGYRVRLWL